MPHSTLSTSLSQKQTWPSRNPREHVSMVESAESTTERVRGITIPDDDRDTKKKIVMTQAAQGAVRLEGDVITANGSILSGQVGNHGDTISLDDETSVCSCCCSGFQKKRRRPRFTVRRSPGKISHLLPMQQLPLNIRSDLHPPPLTPLLQLPPLHQHRASIWRPSTAVSTLSQQQLPRRVSVWDSFPRATKGDRSYAGEWDREKERAFTGDRFNEFNPRNRSRRLAVLNIAGTIPYIGWIGES